jgi:hypothetical protein
MTMSVAVLGAGGKMGLRVARKIRDAGYDLRAVEIAAAGRQRLAEAGIVAQPRDAALSGARAVVLAIPDQAIGPVAAEIAPGLGAGTMLVVLDAAAPYAGALPQRDDLTYFVGHPCHPPLYAHHLTDPDQRADVHGGIAPQAIVCALMQGPEEDYALGAALCQAMWAPVLRTHRVSLEQLAILEPGLSEMIAMAFIDTMAEALDECVERYGIPRQAAFDFLIGHINVETSMWFGFTPKVPSDAALRLIRFAKSVVLQPDWRQALSPAKVREAARLIANG